MSENGTVQKAGEPRLPSFRYFHAGMGPVEIDEAEPSLLDAAVVHEQVDNICLSNSGWERLDVKDGHLRRKERGGREEEGGGRREEEFASGECWLFWASWQLVGECSDPNAGT